MSVDYITKLPCVKGKDAILVIQDQFSGMVHLKAVSEKETATQVWQDCEDTAWKLHGYPQGIRSDRGTVFTSKAWETKAREKGMGHIKTTAYHPQSNGQVERANGEIKRYLQKYINYNQDDWPEHLAMLEYALNSKKAEARTFTPFQIVYRETPAITAKKIMIEMQTRERGQEDAGKVA